MAWITYGALPRSAVATETETGGFTGVATLLQADAENSNSKGNGKSLNRGFPRKLADDNADTATDFLLLRAMGIIATGVLGEQA
ncbi:MAG TPA: hypothetical protein VGQ30_09655 [Gemmatimonadaceae bacterium]|nr:hypothetical protein [Gemmatimonadaceae bacterium]